MSPSVQTFLSLQITPYCMFTMLQVPSDGLQVFFWQSVSLSLGHVMTEARSMTHFLLTHLSVPLQKLPSSKTEQSEDCVQAQVGETVPPQTPFVHLSLTVQVFPSSQPAALLAWTQPA